MTGDFNAIVDRVFVIEPNLIKPTGHPIQYCLALQEYLRQRNYQFCIVPNRRVQKEVLELLANCYPGATNSCFSLGSSSSAVFYNDLCELDSHFGFTTHDLILVTTAYINEVIGSAVFTDHVPRSRCPHIALNFHQLFPPAPISAAVTEKGYQELWTRELALAFDLLPPNDRSISVWTTASEGLNRTLAEVSRRTIGVLPLLFSESRATGNASAFTDLSSEHVNFAFLGDGREEKGLLLFLQAIEKIGRTDISYLVQLIDTRGYSPDDLNRLRWLLQNISNNCNLALIDRSLLPGDFRDLLEKVNAVVLPYHPGHYDRRLSMIFVQAVIQQKPCIVSGGTWMSQEIQRGNGSGLIFGFDTVNVHLTVRNLAESIRTMSGNLDYYGAGAKESAASYKAFNTPERYLQTILDHHCLGAK